MRLYRINNDRDKGAWLQELVARAEADATLGAAILTNALINQARNLRDSFVLQAALVQNAYSIRMEQVAARRAAVELLARYLRDAWSFIKRRAKRESSDAWSTQRHKMHVNKDVTKSLKYKQVIAAAKEILAGEAEMVAAGSEPIAGPSAQQIQDQLTLTETLTTAVGDAKTALANARFALDSQRQATSALHTRIARFFKFQLAELSVPQQREAMRRYGFEFTPDGALTTDEGIDSGVDAGGSEPSDGGVGVEQPTGDGSDTGTDTSTGSDGEQSTGDGAATGSETTQTTNP